MGLSLERRFERYCDGIVSTLLHVDREQPARWYIKGLMLPGERKSVEPMAARMQPAQVRSAHQSMHHLVAEASWSDEAMLSAVAERVLPKLIEADGAVHWIVDDTGFPKKGEHSVGVARQYCGQTGKQDNCRVAVSLSIASERGSVPVGYQLYLPREWAGDDARRGKAGVPQEVVFKSKPELAMQQIEAALAGGLPRGVVLADAAYGDETAWRERLASHGLTYAVGVRPGTTVWWGEHQPLTGPLPPGRGGGAPPRGVGGVTHQHH
jgi:SRSO17 transposase